MKLIFDAGIYEQEFITKNISFILNNKLNVDESFNSTQSMNNLFELYYEHSGILYFCPFEGDTSIVIYINKYDLLNILEHLSYNNDIVVDKTVSISNSFYCDSCGSDLEQEAEETGIILCDECGTIYDNRYKVILSKTLELYFKNHQLVNINSTLYTEGEKNGI